MWGNVELDVALAHLWSQEISEVQQLRMELQQEEEKTSNIANILKSSCLEVTLLPLVHQFSSTLVGGEKKHQRFSINFPNYIEMKKEETIPQIFKHIGEDACQYNFSVAMPRCWLER